MSSINESDSNSSSSSRARSKITFSNIKKEVAQVVLDFKYDQFKSKVKRCDELVNLMNEIPNDDDLYRSIYNELNTDILSLGYPEPEESEKLIEQFSSDVIKIIIKFIGVNFLKCKFNQEMKLEIGRQTALTVAEKTKSFIGQSIDGKADLCITNLRNNGKRIVVIECKTHNAKTGFLQCLMGLKTCFLDNNDGRAVYGFSTTAETWYLLKFDGKHFYRSASIPLLFDEMVVNQDLYARWKENYSAIVKIIYSILSDEVENQLD